LNFVFFTQDDFQIKRIFLMQLPISAFPKNQIGYGLNAQLIATISVENNQLIEHWYRDKAGKPALQAIGLKNQQPLVVDPNNCEWLSQTFFRNQDKLYGFSHIVKSGSTKLFLSEIKAEVDFDSFESVSLNFAKDKYRYYYGPGGKIIKEASLEIFNDQLYLEEAYGEDKTWQDKQYLERWKSRIARNESTLYWDGV